MREQQLSADKQLGTKRQKAEETKDAQTARILVSGARQWGCGLYLVKGLRAEWCWMSGIERWRGCGRDRAPGGEKIRRASLRKSPTALAQSSAGRALPNLCLHAGKMSRHEAVGGI